MQYCVLSNYCINIHLHPHIHTHTLTHTPSHPHRSVEYLDLEKGYWVPVETMLSRRSTLGVAVLNGELYAVGGFDGTNGLDSVEKYNSGVWLIQSVY